MKGSFVYLPCEAEPSDHTHGGSSHSPKAALNADGQGPPMLKAWTGDRQSLVPPRLSARTFNMPAR